MPGLPRDEEVGFAVGQPHAAVDRTARHKVTITHPCTAMCGSSEEGGSDVMCCISHSESKLEQPNNLNLCCGNISRRILPWPGDSSTAVTHSSATCHATGKRRGEGEEQSSGNAAVPTDAPAHSHPRHGRGTLARAGWDPTDLNLRASTGGASEAGEKRPKPLVASGCVKYCSLISPKWSWGQWSQKCATMLHWAPWYPGNRCHGNSKT